MTRAYVKYSSSYVTGQFLLIEKSSCIE